MCWIKLCNSWCFFTIIRDSQILGATQIVKLAMALVTYLSNYYPPQRNKQVATNSPNTYHYQAYRFASFLRGGGRLLVDLAGWHLLQFTSKIHDKGNMMSMLSAQHARHPTCSPPPTMTLLHYFNIQGKPENSPHVGYTWKEWTMLRLKTIHFVRKPQHKRSIVCPEKLPAPQVQPPIVE